jgi:small subunit ribosomal protein S9
MKYFEGIGRRKTSTARVRIYSGKTISTINEKPYTDYFSLEVTNDITKPFAVAGVEGKYYFTAKVSGGGITGQLEAVQLGIGRALVNMDASLKPVLRKAGFITRDPRMVERKKYHRRKARKKPQFSKR